VPRLEADEREQAAHVEAMLEVVTERCRELSVRQFAMLVGVRYPHLTEVLAGRRHPSQAMLANLKAALATERAV